MIINLEEIKAGLPGVSPTIGAHLFEGCMVTLSRKGHSNTGTNMALIGDQELTCSLQWVDAMSDQIERSWQDQNVATENGAVCIAILLLLKLTHYTIVQRSPGKNGFDYYLGEATDPLFVNKARLEVSGIFNGDEKLLKTRFNQKKSQTDLSDYLGLDAYVSVIEFSKPQGQFAKK